MTREVKSAGQRGRLERRAKLCESLVDLALMGADPTANDYMKGGANIARLVLEVVVSRAGSKRHRKAMQDLVLFSRLTRIALRKEDA